MPIDADADLVTIDKDCSSKNNNICNSNINNNNNHSQSMGAPGTTLRATMSTPVVSPVAKPSTPASNANTSSGGGGGGGVGGGIKKFFRRAHNRNNSKGELHEITKSPTEVDKSYMRRGSQGNGDNAAVGGNNTLIGNILKSNSASMAYSNNDTASLLPPQKKKSKRGIFGNLLPPKQSTMTQLTTVHQNHGSDSMDESNGTLSKNSSVTKKVGSVSTTNTSNSTPEPPVITLPDISMQMSDKNGNVTNQPEPHFRTELRNTSHTSTTNNNSKFPLLLQKQLIKERDGFCRRVDKYDGQVIQVEGKAAYELGNYLGGGVAGVVYEGHRLLGMEHYPVRLGRGDTLTPAVVQIVGAPKQNSNLTTNSNGNNNHNGIGTSRVQSDPIMPKSLFALPCIPNDLSSAVFETPDDVQNNSHNHSSNNDSNLHGRDDSLLTERSLASLDNASLPKLTHNNLVEDSSLALEAIDSTVIIDTVDAPSRSKHYAAMAVQQKHLDPDQASDASLTLAHMDETVAIKVLNPVSFRTLPIEDTRHAVVARQGEPLEPEVANGTIPLQERHIWWLVNPQSRNLRTLQRYAAADLINPGPRRVEIDRGSPERGLRLSLIAAYQESASGQLKELPLTKCLEVWGHVPFAASDTEFSRLMTALDRINQGLIPAPQDPARPLDRTATASTQAETISLESLHVTTPMKNIRTGLYRAAAVESRTTVYCEELKAYIALPAVPSKYIKWLKQRRAATKEIRNMMMIGRHKNVVHLFEVLEWIQDNKSTMFLILELVRGGELFDLISSNSAKISANDKIPAGYTEGETVMRKFFRELASGVEYCHANGIAHRDLKPENLLVHNSRTGECVLKIADFGLSASFSNNVDADWETVVDESLGPATPNSTKSSFDAYLVQPPSITRNQNAGNNRPSSIISGGNTNDMTTGDSLNDLSSPIKYQMDRLINAGGNALSFFTCGAVNELLECGSVPIATNMDEAIMPSPMKRMTSVVGSPHYVAPEIISQNERKSSSKDSDTKGSKAIVVGYDGTKADVWSAGVILYAMLYRSLPFGEDLMRCPRYQSYLKWYEEVMQPSHSRRKTALASLQPLVMPDDLDALGPHWFFPSESSPESRDLIVAMLHPNPNERPTIKQVLQHAWLTRL